MTIEEMIAVLQAYKEGKNIEVKKCTRDEWYDCQCPYWNFKDFDYRVKPEPHYRPFESAEEVMEAIKGHGSWILTKSKVYYALKSFHYIGSNGYFFTSINNNASQDDMFNSYTFVDGTPFGKLVEE